LAASDTHSCAIVGPSESGSDPEDGRSVLCWGNNEEGQAVGPNASGTLDSPTSVNGLPQGAWIQILVAPEHSCVTSDDATAYCWGSNSAGRVDPIGSGENLEATEVALFDSVGKRPLTVHPGKFHTCAAADDGSIACWGCGGSGQLGPDLSTCETGAGFSSLAPNCAN
jgi:alpha-tubulin suppressor-like RCC1 family protein